MNPSILFFLVKVILAILVLLLSNIILKINFSISKGYFSSVHFSHSVVSNSLQTQRVQHARLPYPSQQLPELTQTHVHWVSDAIQPSHLQSPPSPPALNLSQHQDLFKWVSPSHEVAKVLELQLQHQSFQWIFRTDFLMDWLDLLAVQETLRNLLLQMV